ncbi:MAG TPA: hypothetical protein VJN89_02080 [Candidatus Acidoferrum sp.]|nr:hypothetical protein [Candidatus Acidoferrum sp.]
MKISYSLLRIGFAVAGLSLALSGCTNAAAPQATDKAALASKSSIIFSGTVSQLAATSFADVPKSAQTIVVKVDSIEKKPAAVSLKKGDSVTVEVKDPSVFQEGAHATFYTDGWIFGSGVAVKELGHELGAAAEPAPVTSAGKPSGQEQDQISDQELMDRMKASDFVVVGRVTDIRKWNAPKPKSGAPSRVTEHDPDWHEAVVEVQSVLKGGKVKGNKVIVRFPNRNDVAWASSPKFAKNQRAIFCLNRDQPAGAPYTGGQKANVYTCLNHGDALPISEEGRVRSLLKNQ